LRVGDAFALVLDNCEESAEAHLATAQAALRAAAGDPALKLARRPSGRPRLEPPWPELGVSLSSRGSLLAVAFSPTGSVGVDIEPDDPALDAARLAVDHFSSAEARLLAACASAGAARDLFLRLWTLKEAVLKATGRGVYDGLAEPNLSPDAATLVRDGEVLQLAAGERVPASQATCRRLTIGGQDHYLALARLTQSPTEPPPKTRR
jgi:4'-phosphopantetheinyl transferase